MPSPLDDYLRHDFLQDVERELEKSLPSEIPSMMSQLLEILRNTMWTVWGSKSAEFLGATQPESSNGRLDSLDLSLEGVSTERANDSRTHESRSSPTLGPIAQALPEHVFDDLEDWWPALK